MSFTIQAGEGATAAPEAELAVYTTRPDTLFGVTYMVVAPEHPLLSQLTTPGQQAQVHAYVQAAGSMSDLERTELQKGKTGIFTGEEGGDLLLPFMCAASSRSADKQTPDQDSALCAEQSLHCTMMMSSRSQAKHN